jgi:hypothetical protein
MTAVLSEVGAATMGGLLFGLSSRAAKGGSFQRVFLPPFERLSAAINYKSAPAMELKAFMAT